MKTQDQQAFAIAKTIEQITDGMWEPTITQSFEILEAINAKSLLQTVIDLHTKFGIDKDQLPEFTTDEKVFRYTCLKEELIEFSDADDPAEELDALIDLIIFALGTVERMGFSPIFEEAFNRVMQANSEKQLGSNAKRNNFSIDLVKPEGWQAPNFDDLIGDMK